MALEAYELVDVLNRCRRKATVWTGLRLIHRNESLALYRLNKAKASTMEDMEPYCTQFDSASSLGGLQFQAMTRFRWEQQSAVLAFRIKHRFPAKIRLPALIHSTYASPGYQVLNRHC